ncbi:MAG: SigB/SigF/SigG family RNA polymerase sigma factor [Solirubrobacterales bacterium]
MPLNKDDRTLLSRYREEGDDRALEKLTERYMPLARRLAARYRYTNEPMEDLVQVANMALLKAIQRFDMERDAAFSSYAVPTILGELKRYFRDHSWSVHVPRDLQERAVKINKTVDGLSKDLGRSPSVMEIGEKLELDLEQVVEALEATQAFDAASLDAERPGQDGNMATLGDTVGDEDPGYEMVEYGAAIQGTLSSMPERTRLVMHLRFVEDLTQAQIAERISVSQMHVSRIIRRALSDLREAVNTDDDNG